MPNKIFLIRHAESTDSRKKRYSGKRNPSLTKEGLEKAKGLYSFFSRENVRFIYSSPLKRAKYTARAIFPSLSSNVNFCDDLREIDFGIWEGLTYGAVMNRYAHIYNQWLNDPYGATIPQAEPLIYTENRVLAFFNQIRSKCREDNIAIVSHYGPIRLILQYVLMENKSEFWQRKIDLASINVLEYDSDKFIKHHVVT